MNMNSPKYTIEVRYSNNASAFVVVEWTGTFTGSESDYTLTALTGADHSSHVNINAALIEIASLSPDNKFTAISSSQPIDGPTF